MNMADVLKNRRSVYGLNKNLPVGEDKVFDLVREAVHYVPDAFNMQSQRVVIVTGEKHTKFWDMVYEKLYDETGGRFSRERTDSFAAAFGTILYFYDAAVVEEMRRKYPLYAANFHDWVMQSNGMLQFVIWTGLANINVGANLQHYNPIIDEDVRKMFDLPEAWTLVAQMPFGGIAAHPEPKETEDVNLRVKIEK